MKKILCYGDSNTFGFNPQNCKRYDKNTRWSGILSELLKNKFEIIEEGMNNRTGFFKNPEGLKQSGSEYLPIYLQNHKDIDICILSLGTNDAQFFYNLNSQITKTGLEKLISTIKDTNSDTQIIIIPPVKITENILNSGFSLMFNKNSIETIKQIFPTFEQTAKENHCLYLDLNEIVSPCIYDGLHYSEDSHKIIAETLAKFILQTF